MSELVLRQDGALIGRTIAILMESDYVEPELHYYQRRFAEEGATVRYLTRLWGNDALTFNQAETLGGAIYDLPGSSLTATGGTFYRNQVVGQDGGFLGKGYDPLLIQGDHRTVRFTVPTMTLPADLTAARLEDRRLPPRDSLDFPSSSSPSDPNSVSLAPCRTPLVLFSAPSCVMFSMISGSP